MEKYRMRILDIDNNELSDYDKEKGYVRNETLTDENGQSEYILRYFPYTEEELEKRANGKRIAELKALLAKTDYQAIKYAEGELTAEEYADTKAQRKAWRAEINAITEVEPKEA